MNNNGNNNFSDDNSGSSNNSDNIFNRVVLLIVDQDHNWLIVVNFTSLAYASDNVSIVMLK